MSQTEWSQPNHVQEESEPKQLRNKSDISEYYG